MKHLTHNTPQHAFIVKAIEQCLGLVSSQDYCAVLWGSRTFGYATDKSDFDINVIHAGNKTMRIVVTSEGQKYDLTFVPRRSLFRVYADSPDLLQLVPLGKIISTSNGLSHKALEQRIRSPEWRRELLKPVNLNAAAAVEPLQGQTPSGVLGTYLRQVYAYMLREHMLGRDTLPLTGVNIRVLAEHVGGPVLVHDIENVIAFRGDNTLSGERATAILALLTRLVNRNIQPEPLQTPQP